MNARRHFLPVLLFVTAIAAARAASSDPAELARWPSPTRTMKPWTRWWWLGSGVDAPNLQRMLRGLAEEGEGGVEICPIYGARGYENRFIDYLSPRWMEMLGETERTAGRLGLGVDLTTGTGWPMGGPWIPDDEASITLTLRRLPAAEDGSVILAASPPRRSGDKRTDALDGMIAGARLRVLCAQAVGPNRERTDLTSQMTERPGSIWRPPGAGWRVYAALARQPVQKVKRAAPGDQGNVIDPYSLKSLDTFLGRFHRAFQATAVPAPRAEFHDSFEYFGANWTPALFSEFARRRGYDLRDQLPALAGDGDPRVAAAVRYDFRRTLSELHREWVAHWTAWSHAHGSLTREQAHGAPANIEDVYAAADIPETEGSFLGGDDSQIAMLKFSSSAAHVTGRTLASSETFTWLGEHFQVPLRDLKPVADRFFLTGTNHIFFHGTPYSPADAPWPGWLFYASVNFGPNGGLWHDLPGFNGYATRCQSILQGGKPDNDVLLYFPIADFWQQAGTPGDRPGRAGDPLVSQLGTPGKWMLGTPFHTLATRLWKEGYSFDEVTDDLLAGARVEPGRGRLVMPGGGSYAAIVVPRTQFLPLGTFRRLLELARAGVPVVMAESLPARVPGLASAADQREMDSLLAGPARGILRVVTNVPGALDRAGIVRERMVDRGLAEIRRLRDDGGTDYFIVNRSADRVDDWVPLARPLGGAILLDPLAPGRSGVAALKRSGDSASLYLQLDPGASLVVRTMPEKAEGAPFPYVRTDAAAPLPVEGRWQVHFLEGGPHLPADFVAERLGSWTDRDDPEARRFAGTAVYRLAFTLDRVPADAILDLGKVADSARVTLNGRSLGILWAAPFTTPITGLLHLGTNELEVEVTNLAANRIADLDRRHVPWKNFYEINFVNHGYKPFDASGWPLLPSGLLGPVTIVPAEPLRPE